MMKKMKKKRERKPKQQREYWTLMLIKYAITQKGIEK